jgi:hypothetical protein
MAIKPAIIALGTFNLTQTAVIDLLECPYGNNIGGHRLRQHNQADTTNGEKPFRVFIWQYN